MSNWDDDEARLQHDNEIVKGDLVRDDLTAERVSQAMEIIRDRPEPPRHRRYLFYLMGGGSLEYHSSRETVERVDSASGSLWIIHHNDAKNTVTTIPTHQLIWMREWDG